MGVFVCVRVELQTLGVLKLELLRHVYTGATSQDTGGTQSLTGLQEKSLILQVTQILQTGGTDSRLIGP